LLCDVDISKLFELVIHARELSFDVLLGGLESLPYPRNVEVDATVRTATSFFDFPNDAARNVIASEQRRLAVGAFVALEVAPAFFLTSRRLRLVVVRNVVEHEPLAHAV